MAKPKRPLKPFRGAKWNESLRRWEGTPPRRAQIKFTTNGKLPWDQKKLRIKIKSAKQKEEDRIYAALKPVWRANPKNHFCQALCKEAGILTPAEPYPHHVRGRGALLNDVRFWLPICPSCHRWIENNRAAAKQKGWLASRDRKTMEVEGIKLCQT